MTNLDDKYRKHSVSESELLILPAAIALEFIDDCAKAGYRILGVDGFIVQADSITLPIEYILDISSQSNNTHETAKDFIKFRESENLFFEVTYD